MATSTDFPKDEPYFSHRFLGSNNLLLSMMLRTGVLVPMHLHLKLNAVQGPVPVEFLGEDQLRQASMMDDQNSLGCMECFSTFIANSRRLY